MEFLKSVNLLFLCLGVVLGTGLVFLAVHRLGRSFARRHNLEDRGPWDRPLATPIPKDKVVAIYKRRKWYHRHHRRHYQRQRDRLTPQ